MSYPGSTQVTITFSFPNRDNTKPPVVTQSCGENDRIPAASTSVYWASSSNLHAADDENLTITGISFYTDSSKTTTWNPPFLDMPGFNFGRLNWVIPFNATPVPQDTTLYYDLKYRDNLYNDLDWDPTLTINMRTASEAGAGA
jgi:hypothetical protein